MNIQAKKLELIEEFLRISDENLILKLETFLKNEKKIYRERNLKPMSINEFREMIDTALKDKDTGNVISHEELKEKVKSPFQTKSG